MNFNQTATYPKGLLRLLCVAGLLCAGTAWAQVNNGGFETGTLAPWTATLNDGSAGASESQGDLVPHSGSYLGYGYDNGGIGSISQPLATIPGESYTFSAWASTTDGTGANSASIRLGTTSPAVSCSLTQNVWTLCTGTFTASNASEPLTLLFQTVSGSGTVGFDDVTVTGRFPVPAVTPVPTLSEWALMLLAAGAAALGAGRLRRKA